MKTISSALGRFALVLGLACCSLSLARAETPAAAPPKFSDQDLEFFEKKVRPILAGRCHECHGAEEQNGSLRLDARSTIVAGGDTGPAIVPGKPEESLLVSAINYGDLYQMPPASKLPDEEIAVLTEWVRRGAPWPKEAAPKVADAKPGFDLAGRKASHWCWQPVAHPQPPAVRNALWPQSAVDRFILAKLEAEGLTPAAPADRAMLCRRLYFDLLGLPPTPEQLDAFLNDSSPRAVENLVDQLLASPRFGERWGRHWLDLVRYAESRGHEFDYDAPNAYQYRDYVIRALNADVPYNDFVVEHIAGDLLDEPRLNAEGHNESIRGTGFWFLGEWVHSPTHTRKDESERFDNMIDVMTKTFLGLTVSCARCHDHKFDAISNEDYYALRGYLQSSSFRQVRFETMEHNRQAAAQLAALRAEYEPKLRGAFVEAARPAVERYAEYLLTTGGLSTRARKDTGGQATRATQKLDPALLAALAAHLPEARKQPENPLRLWAEVVLGHKSEPAALAQAAHGVAGDLRARRARFEEQWSGTIPVVDYAAATKENWIQDGAAFGPRRLGALRLDAGSEGEPAGVFSYGAAAADPAFAVLKLAPGTSVGPGRAMKWDSAGRMIRTPSFTIEKRYAMALVRGSGNAYAAVDSHRMNEGPLHGHMVQRWKGEPDQWHWIRFDLQRYQGSGAHIEFSPTETGRLEIARVVQSDHPLTVLERGNLLLAETLAPGKFSTSAQLAKVYQQLFATTLDKLARRSGSRQTSGNPGDAAGSLATSATDYARLADWMVRHQELFLADGPRREAFDRLKKEYQTRRQKLVEQIEAESHLAMAMLDGNGVNENMFVRGSYKNLGELVPRRFLEALGGLEQPPVQRGSGRLQLARQIVDPANPLTARVRVNRVWHHLFGRGIVGSVDNFGVLGREPTHPALLDYLAAQFVREGWSLKRLIRSLVLTSTYQMSSTPGAKSLAVDPENELLQHARVRRLEAETIRDAILAVSGGLNDKMYGPSVPVHLTPFMQGRGRPKSGPLDGEGRRSIYISVRRNFLSPMMLAFDAPTPHTTIGARNVSNVPAQALILMNDPFVVEQARRWAERILARPGLDARARIEQIYRAAFARPPSNAEVSAALAFLEQQSALLGPPSERAESNPRVWADLCHVMFNVKEFIFIQ